MISDSYPVRSALLALALAATACGDGSGGGSQPSTDADDTDSRVQADPRVAEAIEAAVGDAVALGGMGDAEGLLAGLAGGRLGGMESLLSRLGGGEGPILPELPACVAIDFRDEDIDIAFAPGCTVGDREVGGSAHLHREADDTRETLTIALADFGPVGQAADGTLSVERRIEAITVRTDGLAVDGRTIRGAVSLITHSLTSVSLLAEIEGEADGQPFAAQVDLTAALTNDGLALSGSVAAELPEIGEVGAVLDVVIAPGCRAPEGSALVSYRGLSIRLPMRCEGPDRIPPRDRPGRR